MRFNGCLDLQTLGGAGFASQKCEGQWDLSGYEGLSVNILKRKAPEGDDGDEGHGGVEEDPAREEGDDEKMLCGSEHGDDTASEDDSDAAKNNKKRKRTKYDKTNKLFTLILKDTTSEPNGRGYQKSSLSYEHSFRPSPSTETSTSQPHENPQTETLRIPFTALNPTYRGRKIKPADPEYHELDLQNIRQFSFMVRGFFGEVEKQEGAFELGVVSVRGYEGDDEVKAEGKADYGAWGLLRRVLGWCGR